ncbi:H-NS family histone-like protein [Desulfotalea psychrophila]|nr:H-NS family nucleoid-associated regulatory protein [Desulfotalea psychrophila]
MSSFLKTFLNVRSLNAATRDLSIEQLESTLQKLGKIVEDRKEVVLAGEKLLEAKLAKMKEFKDLMEEDGIDPFEFAELCSTGNVKQKNSPLPPKYEYMDGAELKTWSGYGRTPEVIKNAIKNEGKSKESFLIER